MSDYKNKSAEFRAKYKVDVNKTDYNAKAKNTTKKASNGEQRERELSKTQSKAQNQSKAKGQSKGQSR